MRLAPVAVLATSGFCNPPNPPPLPLFLRVSSVSSSDHARSPDHPIFGPCLSAV